MAAVALVLVLAGCSGKTTGVSNLKATSADLTFSGQCASGEHCSFYVRYRQDGAAAWSKTATKGPVTGPVSASSLSETVTGLTPRTGYEYQACGNAQAGQSFNCVGPDGSTSSTDAFSTPVASVSASPQVGPPTTTVTLSGDGFKPGEAVDLSFDSTKLALAAANASGQFSGVTLTVPASAQPGAHDITAVGRSSGRSPDRAFTVRTDWAQFRYGPTGRGSNPFENTLTPSNVQNLHEGFYAPTGDIVTSSPAVAGDVLYVTSFDGYLYAYPAKCGISDLQCSRLWRTYIGGNELTSSPAVADGVVYVGSQDGKLLAFPASCTDGCSPLWTANTGAVYGSPVVANGVVYVGGGSSLYAFKASCGSGGATCSPLWTGQAGQIESTPAVSGGVVYVGSSSAGTSSDHKLFAFPAVCGTGGAVCTPLWTGTTGGAIRSSPAVSSGVVYVGSDDHKLYAFPAGCGSGGATCSPLWTATTGGPVQSSPTVANRTVYVGSNDDKLYAFPADCGPGCSPLWTGSTGDDVQSSPAVAGGVVYVGSNDDKLYAFPASCGTIGASCSPSWTFDDDALVESSPAVADGWLYAAAFNGFVSGFTLPQSSSARKAGRP